MKPFYRWFLDEETVEFYGKGFCCFATYLMLLAGLFVTAVPVVIILALCGVIK